MSTEVIRLYTDLAEGEALVNPRTGEVLTRESPPDELAAFVLAVRDFEGDARLAKQAAYDWVHEQMDAQNSYSLHYADFDVTGVGPGRVDYDGDQLHAALQRLVEAGHLTQEAADSACKPVTSYKPQAAKLKNLLARGGEVAEAIEACQHPVARRLTISLRKR